MSVEIVLQKICDHNKEVIGCIASHQGAVYRQLPAMYDLVDPDQLSEHAGNVFTLMDGLESGEGAFDRIFMEFHDHSIAARRLDEGVLVIIANPVARAEFRKTEIGINLFMKPLRTALTGGSVGKATTAQPDTVETKTPRPKRMYRGVEY